MGRIDKDDQKKVEHQEDIKEAVNELAGRHGETLSVLDKLRATRKSRGGTGAPLQVPGHLKDAAEGIGIVITDADLNTGLTKAIAESEDE